MIIKDKIIFELEGSNFSASVSSMQVLNVITRYFKPNDQSLSLIVSLWEDVGCLKSKAFQSKITTILLNIQLFGQYVFGQI